jgi:hypothetical protein
MVQLTLLGTGKKFLIDSNLVGRIFPIEGGYELTLKPEALLDGEEDPKIQIKETMRELMVLFNGVRLQTDAEKEALQKQRQKLLATQPQTVEATTIEEDEIPEYNGPKYYFGFRKFGQAENCYILKIGKEPFEPDDQPEITDEDRSIITNQILTIVDSDECNLNAIDDDVHFVSGWEAVESLTDHFKRIGWETCEANEVKAVELV